MANAPVNYLLPVLQQETLIKLSGSHRREDIKIEGGLVDKGFNWREGTGSENDQNSLYKCRKLSKDF